MSNSFMTVDEFVPGVKIRAGKGFTCMGDGEVLTVETDPSGNPCLRCQYTGQSRKGYHYPTLDFRSKTDDGRLKELFLVATALAQPT